MKLKPSLMLAGQILFTATLPASEPGSAGSTLIISNAGDASTFAVEIQDAANRTWSLQQSADPGDADSWTTLEELKVHNGSFATRLHPGPASSIGLFRAILDPENGSIESTIENALRLPAVPHSYTDLDLPAHLRTPLIAGQDNTPADNPITDAGALLGRVLFYDKRLSANQTVSCSSCHQAEHGFSDPRRFSTGFEGGLTDRNSMGLTSARYYQRGAFFWDERAATLEAQVLQPIQNEVEMGMTLTGLTDRLAAEPFYTELFTDAFGSTEVTADRIARALAQFVRSIVSDESKYDLGVASGFTNFTAQENRGRRLFFGQVGNATCSTCHGSDNFVPGPNIHNNGLENPYVDKGVGARTGRPQDEGLFKVPSLRNIELTAPYMHDGRLATLEEVVEFYNSGVVNHPNLSPPLRTPTGPGQPPGQPLRLNLSAPDKAALVAFLKTLTDLNVTSAERFGDPFNYGD